MIPSNGIKLSILKMNITTHTRDLVLQAGRRAEVGDPNMWVKASTQPEDCILRYLPEWIGEPKMCHPSTEHPCETVRIPCEGYIILLRA